VLDSGAEVKSPYRFPDTACLSGLETEVTLRFTIGWMTSSYGRLMVPNSNELAEKDKNYEAIPVRSQPPYHGGPNS